MCDKTDVMPKDLRMWLFHYIMGSAGVSSKLIGPGKPLDTSCIIWSDEGKGHLIRVFGGKKQKYKTFITEIPEEKPKDELEFPDSVDVWHIPENLFEEFINHFKKSQKERVEAIQRYEKASQNFTGMYVGLPCIQRILQGMCEGQRNAGARIIAIGCCLDKMSREEAQNIMRMYAGTCSPDNISESEYLSWLDWIYSQENLFWNCRFSKELTLCEQQKCALHESVFTEEHSFLKDTTLLQNVSRILDKKIKKEEKNKLIVLFTYLSAYGSNPLNLFLKGESSIGKTYLAKSVAEYFPDEDVWFIGDMSPKALIHEHGRFENGKMYVSLRNKILVFLESPRKETLDMLKPILSHDRTEIEYKIADKNSSGKLQTKSVIIEGWPSTIFCTTDLRVLEELSTRSLLTTPESTQEKIGKVLEYKGKKYARPWEEMKLDAHEILFRNALKLLKTKKEVCIPYADELQKRQPTSEPRVMRDFDKLMELIRMSAFLHQYKRPSFKLEINGCTKEFIIATECDYIIGVELFDHVRETTVTGLPQPVLDFYEKVVSSLDQITYSSMMKKFKEVYGKLIGRDKLRRKYVDPLETVGWLDEDKDPSDGRQKIFERCIDANDDSRNIRNCTQLVFKDTFSEYKLKENLKDIERVCAQNGGCDYIVYGGERLTLEKNDWFYCDEECAHFSEEEEEITTKLKEGDNCKSEQRINAYNSEEINIGYGKSGTNLIDQYDEETVLLQIPQEDTRVEDVVKKFKNQNKVVDVLVFLKENGKIIAGVINGQGYIRRISRTLRLEEPDILRSGLNRWTCGECGIRFYAQEPYRNRNDYAICDDCKEKSDIS